MPIGMKEIPSGILTKHSVRHIQNAMSTMKHIRTNIFEMSQGDFAKIAGVTQSLVSKWENGIQVPDHAALQAIRTNAIERGIEWNDAWFFEVPAAPHDAE